MNPKNPQKQTHKKERKRKNQKFVIIYVHAIKKIKK